jgi:uncharacterized protein YecT (DUF1311 family)
MFKKKPTDEAIATALARAEEVLDERTRIEAAITKTSAEIQTTETELEQALERLAIEEAARALVDDNSEDRETPAQRGVQSLRLRLEAQQARLRGLHRKLTEHEEQVRDAQDALTVARDAWMRARAAEFATEYKRAVADIAVVLRKGAAVGDALGNAALSAAMRQARLYDPENLSHSMLNMEPVRTHAATGMIERYPVWQDDPAAVSVHNALVGVRQAAEKLDSVANKIRQRREEAAREEQRRRFESEPSRPAVTYNVHYPPEYSPIPAVEVIKARIGGGSSVEDGNRR